MKLILWNCEYGYEIMKLFTRGSKIGWKFILYWLSTKQTSFMIPIKLVEPISKLVCKIVKFSWTSVNLSYQRSMYTKNTEDQKEHSRNRIITAMVYINQNTQVSEICIWEQFAGCNCAFTLVNYIIQRIVPLMTGYIKISNVMVGIGRHYEKQIIIKVLKYQGLKVGAWRWPPPVCSYKKRGKNSRYASSCRFHCNQVMTSNQYTQIKIQ